MALLHLLKGAESISSLRDRNAAAATATTAIVHLLQPLTFCWLRSTGDHTSLSMVSRIGPDGLWLSDADKIGGTEWITLEAMYQQYPEALQAIHAREYLCTQLPSRNYRIILPFFNNKGRLGSILIADCSSPLRPEQQYGIECFVQFYTNYLALLDYSELDSLTGLNNRKTFDESLDRLLDDYPAKSQPGDRRKVIPLDCCWLAVIDIDHFKRVNDTWGHIFGDETLIRFSKILKQTFRNEDRLFRFGGEEFIAIIRAENSNVATHCFERFRNRLADSDFPHVGKITCSIGFTRLNPSKASIDILGSADRALYFAKTHGRNQTCYYEGLVKHGQIDFPAPKEGNREVDFDIDAFFG